MRASLPQFRQRCYEPALRSNRSLQGRVSVRFVIDLGGVVTLNSDGGSDLPNGDVVRCYVRAFSALRFPRPEGGMVTVTYPVMLSP